VRKLVPPAWLLLTLLAMTALHVLLPVDRLVPAPWHWTGLLLVAAGLTVMVQGAGLFRRAGTPLRPFQRSTSLVTHGIYRYTRNPMYLGMVVLLIGAAVLFASLSVWLPVLLFFLIIEHGFVRAEEPFLEELFGDEYRRYRERVRRWL
jgi:protein-S-isoprenylcysteine O-methyltransferase Ste14